MKVPAAPKNPNAAIHWVVHFGHTEMIKILAPLTDQPNLPNEDGTTPIFWQEKMDIKKLYQSWHL